MDVALLFACAYTQCCGKFTGASCKIKSIMVSSLRLEPIEPKQLFLDRLPLVTQRAFLLCAKLPFLKNSNWYLAGGTALALQAGHRQSVDLDFFTTAKDFKERLVERKLFATNQWTTTYLESGTIYGTFANAKMSLIAYPFFIPSNRRLSYGNINILIPDDIAAMKIAAISQRGRKRDFIDLYWHCINRQSLIQTIQRAIKQYPGQENNLTHILKSLTYFDDAENDPMPKLFFKTSWKEIKDFFKREVKQTAGLLWNL